MLGQQPSGGTTFNCDLNQSQEGLELLLRAAITHNNESCTRKVLGRSIKPSGLYRNIEGTDPIRVASVSNVSVGIIDALFGAGLDPKSDEVRKAFFRVCATGQYKLVGRFITAKVPVNGKSVEGETALMFATGSGDFKTVKLLLEKGADPEASTIEGITPLITSKGDENVIRMLLESKARIDATDINGQSALFYSIKNLQLEKIKLLLKFGANPVIKDKNGITPVAFAKQLPESKTRNEIISTLLRYGR